MKKASLILIVSILLFSLAYGVYANDPVSILQPQKGAIGDIIELLEQDEKKAASEKLNSLHSAVIESRASLRGWVFEGSSGKRLTDLFKLPVGTYRVHFTTKGFGTIEVIPLKEGRKEILFILLRGEASDGASAVYRSNGEEVMIQFSNISQPYKLVLEKLG